MIIIEKEIENQKVVLEVDETLPDDKLGGVPLLKIDNDLAVIYPVDTLKVIKGIATADTLNDLVESVKGSWAEKGVKKMVVNL